MNHFSKWTLFVLFIAATTVFSCEPCTCEKEGEQVETEIPSPLLGAWEMTSVHWITADTTYSIDKAQPGIFIFDPSRYSIMWTPIEEERIPFEDLSNPTEEEMIAGFGSVVFNGGTYVMTDSTVTTTATIAKVPGFEGGIQFYRYTIADDVLELTMFDETYPNGDKPQWFGRYETKFVMNRAN